MSFEIERKFLVTGDYKSLAQSSSRITQGYISTLGGATVRIRLRDERGYLTIKGPSRDGGLSRYEFEKEIEANEAHSLLSLCDGPLIDKTRWLVPTGSHTFEVDEFHGENAGLVVAEVELGSPQEPYERPPFVGKEVTGDPRYYNSHLRLCPFKQWKENCSEEI